MLQMRREIRVLLIDNSCTEETLRHGLESVEGRANERMRAFDFVRANTTRASLSLVLTQGCRTVLLWHMFVAR